MISAALSVLETDEQRNKLSDFYKKTYSKLFAIAYSILHNRHSAEDAIQDTFLRIAEKPEKFFSFEDNKRYCFCVIIIRNVCIDVLRKNNKLPCYELNEDIIEETALSVEDAVLGEISCTELIEFINTLPKLQKDVLTLYTSFNLSYIEISNVLKISEVAVRQRLFQARRKINEFIESRYKDEERNII